MYVIQVDIVDGDPSKRRQPNVESVWEGEPALMNTDGDFALLNETEGFETLDPIGSSMVSGLSSITATESNPPVSVLTSTLIPSKTMDRYHSQAEKLRRDLKGFDLCDHKWELQSYDQDGVGIVKLYCCECRKEMGGYNGNHNKPNILNLFLNFRTSHL